MAFRRLRPHHSRTESLPQFAPDGRNLSDTTHPDYNPETDPELQLRIVRTAASSIHESIMEEQRRRIKRTESLKQKIKSTPLRPRSKSIFGRKKNRPRSSTGQGSLPEEDEELDEDDTRVTTSSDKRRSKLEQQATQANAAAEAQESARRQEKQDGSGWKLGFRKGKRPKPRRTVYVNVEGAMTDPRGYERNKVRTSKYTLVSFVPKNLSEQFRRIANIYFLALVILQGKLLPGSDWGALTDKRCPPVFPIFGAVNAQIGMLPLLAVLGLTAIKDGIEDGRRHSLDNAVNNSAVTRLGDWNNVNQPVDTRAWWQFWKSPTRSGVSRGVRKLREKEGEFDAGFLYTTTLDMTPTKAAANETLEGQLQDKNNSMFTIDAPSALSSYPPNRARSETLESSRYATSSLGRSTKPSDVLSYTHPTAGTAKWERTLWKKLEVGDVILLKENEQIPADVVVLSSSDSDGVCFIETKNLDGETNLKPRKSLKATMGINNEEDIEHARFWVECEAPHANLYSFNGVLKYRLSGDKLGTEHPIIEGKQLADDAEMQEPVTINELLLRGCALRNTKWVIALVVFTGADTKIMLNQGETPSKRSKIEKETNFNVLANFAILMSICIGCAVGQGVLDNKASTSADFFEVGAQPSASSIVNAIVTFGATLILFQNIVPISLVITVELVKTIQAFFIYQDVDMYYEPLDHPCVPKTWNISDDLGQIEYIFSDKTGTLTQNVMEFQKCAVDGVAYGDGITEAMVGAAKRQGTDSSALDPAQNSMHLAEQKQQTVERLKAGFSNPYLREEQLTLISPVLASALTTSSDHQRRLIEFWRALAICHTVLADRFDPDQPNLIEYKAESPDEAALVSAARDVGFVFLNRTTYEIELNVMGQTEKYVPLRTLAFNSSRKRMSTIVRTPDNRILLICKGADSVIYQRLMVDHDQELMQSTTQHLEDFANAGLRTLCISSKYISEDEFIKWSKIYDAACASIDDREEQIEKACEMIEGDLTILGATALEDKLQVGVPEAIEQLHKAGIKLWILTGESWFARGDKLQTAIEIGFSCNLLSNQMDIIILSAESGEGATAQIKAALDKVTRVKSDGAYAAHEKDAKSGGFAVVIDGETLSYALSDGLKPMFLELTTQCETVVCCRVSPSQKALTVKLVKDGCGAMTLAIGDGANDVAMIQEAHIGVGIAGLEGAQASMSADYAFGQFRFLTKLLIVHGRWCYIRIADMHATFFYKQIIWTITLFFYQIYCNFDSTYLYEYTLIMLFSLVFTSLPVAVLGIFDQDVNAKTALAYPQLYRRGIFGLEWTRPKFFGFMFDGLYQSAVSFFVPYAVYAFCTSLSVTGRDVSLWDFGTTVAACAVTSANLYVGLHIRYWTWMAFVIIFGSTLAFHVWIAIYSQFPVFAFQNELTYLYSTFAFWLCMALTLVVNLGPKYLYNFVQSTYFPHDSDIVRELQMVSRKPRKHTGGPLDPESPPLPVLEIQHDEFDDAGPVDVHTPYKDDFGSIPASPAPYGAGQRSLTSSERSANGSSIGRFASTVRDVVVPTVNVQSPTPRASLASTAQHRPSNEYGGIDHQQQRYNGLSDVHETQTQWVTFSDPTSGSTTSLPLGETRREVQSSVSGAPTIDLTSMSPLDQTRIAAKHAAGYGIASPLSLHHQQQQQQQQQRYDQVQAVPDVGYAL
ncbi:phospholipid transporting ATPase [Microbotryomycetes sp. JL201]|nr:phospholipid transporting ATPase [Microbotryomycetes sp. JL201]